VGWFVVLNAASFFDARHIFRQKPRIRPKVPARRGKRCEISLTFLDRGWGYGLGAPANRLAIGRVAG
jgi:hypothetical protein